LIVDTFKNVVQRRSSEVFKPDVPEFGTVQSGQSIQCHILYMLVGPLQKVDKNMSSESGQFLTDFNHSGVKQD